MTQAKGKIGTPSTDRAALIKELQAAPAGSAIINVGPDKFAVKYPPQAPAQVAPFKLMLVDKGDWIIFTPKFSEPFKGPSIKAEPRKEFKKFHGRAPSRSARLYIVPSSYALNNGGMTVTMSAKQANQFSPVEVC